MRDLAAYVMRGPKQAAMVALLSTLIPMMFWLGAAVVGLVTLRQGASKGMAVLVWAILPALGWWVGMQDPGAFIVLMSVFVMASVLRMTVSWQSTLVAGVVASVLVGLIVPWVMPELIDTLVGMADQVFRNLAEDAKLEYDDRLQASFRSLMIASFAASFFGMALGALCLSRSWQSQLYNPGGWRQEFHSLRLSFKTMLVLLGLLVIIPVFGADASLVMVVLVVPVTLCGIALVHGVIGKKNLGGQWLFGFYLLVVMLFPTVLMVVAMMALLDSVFDFRRSIEGQAPPEP